MPQVCTVCRHTERASIDAALVDGVALRDIAGRFGLTKSSVERHKAEHLSEALAKAREAEEVARADDLLDQLRTLQKVTMGILGRAINANDLRTAVSAVGQARGNLELLGKLLGELDERPQVNILLAPEWVIVRGVLIEALMPWPDARSVVASRLLALEAGNGHR